MSVYTSVMLYISGKEFEKERVKEVNQFRTRSGDTINLIDVNVYPFPDIFPRFIYAGTYKYFQTDLFLDYLSSKVKWEYPEDIKVVIKEELEESIKVYSVKDRRWLA